MSEASLKRVRRSAFALFAVVGASLLAACGGGPTNESVCQRSASAGCTGFDMASCVSTGNAAQSRCASMGLSSQYQSYLNCANSGTFACSSSGQPVVSSCSLEALAVLPCFIGGDNDSGTNSDASSQD